LNIRKIAKKNEKNEILKLKLDEIAKQALQSSDPAKFIKLITQAKKLL
jgi:hypothetical protein